MPKPTPDQIVVALQRMLPGSGSQSDYTQGRTTHVSVSRFAEICGYTSYTSIPESLFEEVCLAAMNAHRLLVIAGWHTVLIGDDFHPKSVGSRST